MKIEHTPNAPARKCPHVRKGGKEGKDSPQVAEYKARDIWADRHYRREFCRGLRNSTQCCIMSCNSTSVNVLRHI